MGSVHVGSISIVSEEMKVNNTNKEASEEGDVGEDNKERNKNRRRGIFASYAGNSFTIFKRFYYSKNDKTIKEYMLSTGKVHKIDRFLLWNDGTLRLYDQHVDIFSRYIFPITYIIVNIALWKSLD